jgi:hypothetical protein
MEFCIVETGEKRCSMLSVTLLGSVRVVDGHDDPVEAQMGGRIFKLNNTSGGSSKKVFR